MLNRRPILCVWGLKWHNLWIEVRPVRDISRQASVCRSFLHSVRIPKEVRIKKTYNLEQRVHETSNFGVFVSWICYRTVVPSAEATSKATSWIHFWGTCGGNVLSVNSLNKKKSLSLSIHTHIIYIQKIKAEKRLKLVGHIYRGARSSTEDNSLTTGRRFCGCFHDKLVKEKPPRAPWKPCNAEKELLVSSIEEKKSHGTSKLTRVDWERRRRGEEKKTDFDSAN